MILLLQFVLLDIQTDILEMILNLLFVHQVVFHLLHDSNDCILYVRLPLFGLSMLDLNDIIVKS